MANTLLTNDVIADQAIATLYESIVMAALVHRDYEATFAQKVGGTITIRKPATFVAHEYTRQQGIIVQDANETGVPMTLNHFADVSFGITAEDWTLRIQDFDAQLLTPAMEALAQKIDRDILALRDDVTQEVGDAVANAAGEDYMGYAGDYPYSDSRVLIQAGMVLDQQKVPLNMRRVVTGPITAARWRAEKVWRHADKRGDTEGLREAVIGPRVHGFDPYMTQNVDPPAGSPGTGEPTTEVGVAFHETAFALAVRPLALPRSNTNATIRNYKGIGLRIIFSYDPDAKMDVCSCDVLYGTKTLSPERAVLIKGADA